MNHKYKISINIPSWAAIFYIIISIGMIPCVLYLAISLPADHTTRNWDIIWVGLDIAEIASLLATAWLVKMKSIYVILFAIITGTLFLMDAWFDILSYHVGSRGFDTAVLMATFGELPLSALSYLLAINTVKKLQINST